MSGRSCRQRVQDFLKSKAYLARDACHGGHAVTGLNGNKVK